GQGAPISTQRVRSATCSRGSFLEGGILRCSSAWLSALISRLFPGWPGTRAGPESPPASAAGSESRRRPPRFLDPWHLKQLPARTGRTFVSKKRAAAGPTAAVRSAPAAGAVGPAASASNPSAAAAAPGRPRSVVGLIAYTRGQRAGGLIGRTTAYSPGRLS